MELFLPVVLYFIRERDTVRATDMTGVDGDCLRSVSAGWYRQPGRGESTDGLHCQLVGVQLSQARLAVRGGEAGRTGSGLARRPRLRQLPGPGGGRQGGAGGQCGGLLQ